MIAVAVGVAAPWIGAVAVPFVLVGRSLPDLLSDGFDIVSMNEGVTGAGILLRKGHAYILCTIGSGAKEMQLYTICQRIGRD